MRTFNVLDHVDLLTYLQDGRYSLRQIAKQLGKGKSTVQEVVSDHLIPEFVNSPIKGSIRGYRSSRSVYTLTARGNEVVSRYGTSEELTGHHTIVTSQVKPDISREEYQSLHHITLRIPFTTPRPSKLPYMIVRTQDPYVPKQVDKGNIDNWNYIKDNKVPVRIKGKKDSSWFPGITVHDKMAGWHWYTFQEEIDGHRITTKIWRNGIDICLPELKATTDSTAYDMISEQLDRYLPYILELQGKLQQAFTIDLNHWIPRFKQWEKGMFAMTLTAEIAHVGDEFARIVYRNGKPGQRVMRWYAEDGKERMHIDWSHNPDGPEIELTGSGTFAEDSEALRTFKKEIGPREYKDLAKDMDPRTFGDMILDRADGKWHHREEQLKVNALKEANSELKKEIQLLQADKERDISQVWDTFKEMTGKMDQLITAVGHIAGVSFGGPR